MHGDPLMIGDRPTKITKKQEWGEGMEEEGARQRTGSDTCTTRDQRGKRREGGLGKGAPRTLQEGLERAFFWMFLALRFGKPPGSIWEGRSWGFLEPSWSYT